MLLCDGIVTKEGQIKPSGPQKKWKLWPFNYYFEHSTTETRLPRTIATNVLCCLSNVIVFKFTNTYQLSILVLFLFDSNVVKVTPRSEWRLSFQGLLHNQHFSSLGGSALYMHSQNGIVLHSWKTLYVSVFDFYLSVHKFYFECGLTLYFIQWYWMDGTSLTFLETSWERGVAHAICFL